MHRSRSSKAEGVRYDEVLGALQKALKRGIVPSLDAIRTLCDVLGRPQDAFRSIQVTGTNGKTSTARLIAALLRAQGVRTGLYTSPELERYPERIEVDGMVIADDEFARAIGVALDAARTAAIAQEATEFELLTAAALWLFREVEVEVAVLEVGIGGRWDATSVVAPEVAVITSIGMDHTDLLGGTLRSIAEQKADIIRSGSVGVLGSGALPLAEVFIERAVSVGAPLVVPSAALRKRPSSPDGCTVTDVRTPVGRYDGLSIAAPAYQAANIGCAIAAVEAAMGGALARSALDAALADVTFPGRFELLAADPPVVVDGSHNPQAAATLVEAVRDAWQAGSGRPHILLGVLSDKDATGMIAELAPVAGGWSVTQPDSPRALPARELARVVERVAGVAPSVFPSIREALEALEGRVPHGLVITGSLKTAGEARRLLRERRGGPVRP